MSSALYAATLVTALGCGLIAGVFFAFSSFVMAALRRLPTAEGVAAMQSINRFAVTPAVMTALFGTGAACLLLGVWTVITSDWLTTVLVLPGSALYLAGTIGVTIVCNVPLNDALAKLSPRSVEATGRWQQFLTRWTLWNHVRTVAALAAAGVLTIALQT